VSDGKKTAAEQKAAESERGPAAPATGRPLVGESTDPEVHRLLAVRQAHQTRLAELEPDDEARREAEDAIRAVDDELAERGYQR
jgi:hypothetical protein